ncbi:MAG: hypothetical protein RR964_09940 [Lachnospiraceae bacterium]
MNFNEKPIENVGTATIQMIVVFLLYNVPTAILLVIYLACREKVKKGLLLDEPNIQDL